MSNFFDCLAELRRREQEPFYAELVDARCKIEADEKKKREWLRPYVWDKIDAVSLTEEWEKRNSHKLPRKKDGRTTFLNPDGSEASDENGKLWEQQFAWIFSVFNSELDKLMALPTIPVPIEEWLNKHYEREEFEWKEWKSIYLRKMPPYKNEADIERILDAARNKYAERTKPCDLYRFYDSNGTLLYVGISNKALIRAYQHSKSGKWFEKFSYMEREICLSREHAMEAEKRAIVTEHPIFNVVHSVREGVL